MQKVLRAPTAMLAAVGPNDAGQAPSAQAHQRAQGLPHRTLKRARLGEHLDRKSTRLNSSHLGISYAVFCLKKKKKTKNKTAKKTNGPCKRQYTTQIVQH